MKKLDFLIYRLVLSSILFLSFSAEASNLRIAEAVDGFKETVSQDVLVSGSVIVGVTSAVSFSGKDIENLVINPVEIGKEFCLDVTSADGIYTASNKFRVPSDFNVGDMVAIPYGQSRYLRLIEEYRDPYLAIRAVNGGCDNLTNQYYVIESNKARGEAGHAVRLYVNSFGATDVFAHIEDEVEVACELTSDRRTSYDYICEIPWITKRTSAVAYLLREKFGRLLPEVSLTIISPNGWSDQ